MLFMLSFCLSANDVNHQCDPGSMLVVVVADVLFSVIVHADKRNLSHEFKNNGIRIDAN